MASKNESDRRSVAKMPSAGNIGKTCRVGELKNGTTEDRAVVVIETVTLEMADPFNVTADGVTLQDAAAGAPAQVNEMDLLKPPSGLAARVKLVAWPAETVAEAGEAERAKSIPAPESAAVCGLPVALSAIERVPGRVPPVVGLNVILIVQEALGATLAPQALV
jgi:hypothetical protein